MENQTTSSGGAISSNGNLNIQGSTFDLNISEFLRIIEYHTTPVVLIL